MSRSQAIKDSIDLKSYIERYGQFNGSNKMCCPLPGHDDKTPSFTLTNKTHWHCYGCDRGGSIIDFVQHYDGLSTAREAMDKLDGKIKQNGNANSNGHVDLSKAPQQKTPSQKPGRTTYKNMGFYANKKYNTSVKVFEKWGCKNKDINGIPHMTIPTSDTIDRLRNLSATGAKYQPDPTNPLVIEKMKRRKAKKQKGETILPEDRVQSQWFGLKKAQERSVTEHIGKTLVLCNGQTSTMIAHEHGVPAFCKTDGENIIPRWLLPELIALLSSGWKLYIALDCDNDGKGHKIAVKIITQLHQYRPVFIDFGRDDGFDLADFCIKHQDKSWVKLQECAAGLPGNISEQAINDLKNSFKEIAKAQRSNEITTIPQLIDEAEARIEILRSEQKPPEDKNNSVSSAYRAYLEARDNPRWITGLTCDINALNYRLGGFQDDAVYTWIGETGAGKTTLSISCAAAFLEQCPGLVVIGEAGEKQIINRLVGHLAEVPWASLGKGKIRITEFGRPDKFLPFSTEQDKRICKAYHKVLLWQERGILNLRDEKKPLTTASMKAQLRKAVDENGVRWAIMESNDNIPTKGANSEYERITEAMVAFERMATTHHIPVFTSSQGGRNTKGRSDKKLKRQDGLGSNHVEGKSYGLMAIYNHWGLVENEEIVEKDNDVLLYPKGTARIYIRKLRDDKSGGYITAKFVGGAGWYNYEEVTK